MNFYGLSQLVSGVLSALLGVFVLRQDPNNKTYKTFFYFCISLTVWGILYFFWLLQSQETPAIMLLRIFMGFVCFIHSFYLHFILELTQRINKHLKALIASYASSCIFFVIFVSGVGFSPTANKKYFAAFWPDGNLLTALFAILQIMFVSFALYTLYTATSGKKQKTANQYKYIFVTSIIGWAGGLTNWFLWFNIQIPPFGNPLIIIFTAGMTYAILKHQLLDISIIFKRSLIYSISLTILTFCYLIIIFAIEHIFRGVTGYKSLGATTLSLIALALVFQPIKNYIQRFIDNSLFRGSIDKIDEENIKLRDELQKSEKLKAISTLAAGMAHEIKNPLTSIKTFTEYLPEKGNDPDFRKKFQRIVGNEVERINTIVKQLLEFSKPSELKLEQTDILALLESTLELLNNDLLNANVSINKSYTSPLPKISIDPSQIKQVFLNLILNALDAMPNGGAIRIEVHNTLEEIIIKITDSGKGIKEEDLKHIFDPFFSKKDGGTGLGLSVVHGIIKKHGGKISAVSFIGKGTTFTISFPI